MNDYQREVEQALADLPPHRRAAVLADLSRRITARRAELQPDAGRRSSHVGIRSLLDILDRSDDDWDEIPDDEIARQLASMAPDHVHDARSGVTAAEWASSLGAPGTYPPPESATRRAGRRMGALAWVLIMAVSMILMCAAGVVLGTVFLVHNAHQLGTDDNARPSSAVSPR